MNGGDVKQAPLSKGAGCGESRRLGDCVERSSRSWKWHFKIEEPLRHAASFKRHLAVRQSLRHGLRPCHLPLTREAERLQPGHLPLTREAKRLRPPIGPLSKGAGCGESRRLGDCPPVACRSREPQFEKEEFLRRAASFNRHLAVRQSLRHGLRPCHLPLTREAKRLQPGHLPLTREAKRLRPGSVPLTREVI